MYMYMYMYITCTGVDFIIMHVPVLAHVYTRACDYDMVFINLHVRQIDVYVHVSAYSI